MDRISKHAGSGKLRSCGGVDQAQGTGVSGKERPEETWALDRTEGEWCAFGLFAPNSYKFAHLAGVMNLHRG